MATAAEAMEAADPSLLARVWGMLIAFSQVDTQTFLGI